MPSGFSGKTTLRYIACTWMLEAGWKLTHRLRFGWTGYTVTIHWMAPVSAGVLLGFGIFCIFLQCFNYLVDCYPTLCVLLACLILPPPLPSSPCRWPSSSFYSYHNYLLLD